MVKDKTQYKCIVELIDREDNMYREVGNNNTYMIQQLRQQLHHAVLERNELQVKLDDQAKNDDAERIKELEAQVKELEAAKRQLSSRIKKMAVK